MVSTSVIRISVAVLCVLLVVGGMTSAAPAMYTDYDNLRDLYELLVRNEAFAPVSRYSHQMERKGGRTPSLRLRFGRRADPSWEPLTALDAAEASTN